MADQATLQAEKRTVMGKAVKRLRKEGLIPANVANNDGAPTAIQIDRHELERFMKTHGRTTLIRLTITGAPEQTTMIAHVQREPVSGQIQHVDFLHVQMNQLMHTRVP